MPSTNADGTLTRDQIESFQKNGYLLIPDFFDAQPLLQQAKHLISSFDLQGHPMTKFSTGEGENRNEKHVGDRYFLESGDKIRYFFEEDAIKDGKLIREKEKAVNKCGHALHALDPVFNKFSFSERIQNLARSLNIHSDPRVLQSMIICKQPSIGGAVPPHNDSTFLYTSSPSAVGLWFALEDCTTSNGCLSFIPGSHRWPTGKDGAPQPDSDKVERPQVSQEEIERLGQPRGVNRRFVRKDPANPDAGTGFEQISDKEELEWDSSLEKVGECKAGTLVLIHGSVAHKSTKNTSEKSRFIYTYHMIEGDETKAHYDKKNWLQPTQNMPFSRLYDPPTVV